jgi:hypothetical protein
LKWESDAEGQQWQNGAFGVVCGIVPCKESIAQFRTLLEVVLRFVGQPSSASAFLFERPVVAADHATVDSRQQILRRTYFTAQPRTEKCIPALNLGFSRSQHRGIAHFETGMSKPQKLQSTGVNTRSAGGTSCAAACAIIRGAN